MLILILGLSAATIASVLTGAYIARHRRMTFMTIERMIRAWERGDLDNRDNFDKKEGA